MVAHWLIKTQHENDYDQFFKLLYADFKKICPQERIWFDHYIARIIKTRFTMRCDSAVL